MIGASLVFQGNGSVSSVPVNQPPIKLAGLIEGAKYRLRVYSNEYHSITSNVVTFETSAGETPPAQLRRDGTWPGSGQVR